MWLVVPRARVGGLEPAVIVPKGEKENNSVYGKGASAATGRRPSWGDRGPLLGKQEERISRTHRATRRPPAPASSDSQQLLWPPAACLSIVLSVSPSDHKTQASSFGVKPQSVLSPTVRRGGKGGRHLDASVSCPQATQGQHLTGAHWVPSFRQNWEHGRPGSPGVPDPCGNPPRTAPHCPLWRTGSVRSQQPGVPGRVALDLRPKEHRALRCQARGERDTARWSGHPEQPSPSASPFHPGPLASRAQWSPCHCCASSPWPARCSLAGPAAAQASVHVRVFARIGTHARHSHTRAQAHTHRLQAPIVSTVAPAPAPGARP